MSAYELAGTGKAKAALIAMLQDEAQELKVSKLCDVHLMTYANARDCKLRQTPSISLDKVIRHLRFMGHTITLTVDGLTLPIGD